MSKSLGAFFLFMLLVCHIRLLAQYKPTDSLFKLKIKDMGITFNRPNGYSDFKGPKDYYCSDHKTTNVLDYLIVNKDSSVVISFSLMGYNKLSESMIKKNFNPSYDFNKNYLISAKNLADTTNDKVVFYKKKYSKEKFNADEVVQITRACNVLFIKKYPFIKMLFGVKNDVAQFQITYFYTEAAKQKIDKVIKDTAGVIKFKGYSASN